MDITVYAMLQKWITKAGGSIPPVDSGDEGKFLQVVDGVPVWVALIDANKEAM